MSDTGKAWEDLRREARKMEGELDMKLAAYGKLCSGFEYGGFTKGESGIATEQALQSKSAEIEAVLARLSDVNESMRSTLSGGGDSRAHTIARHRDILYDFTQEFRRLSSIVGAARDRAELLGGQSGPNAMNQSSMGLLLRERNSLATSNSALDDVMGTAQGIASSLSQQRQLFDTIGGKMSNLGARFPVVNTLLNAIRRRKNRDNVILAAVVAACILFVLIYWANK